jgi:hypothetical protein
MTIRDDQVLQRSADGTAQGLPMGGPYTVEGAQNVYVGDLWVLAGQSNMEGVGDLTDVETPSPFVHSYQSREEWAIAEEPLHWLGESPRFVHHQLWGRTAMPDLPDPRDPQRAKGSGLGLTFGKTYHALTGIPVGLIPSAHGGTSMAQWNPMHRDKGGDSLYGATYARVQAVGGKVKGILWYQGESDASPSDAALYADRMTALVQAFRADFGQPDLPFYLVQLGCFETEPSADGIAGWNAVREAQRVWSQTMPNVDIVSAIDLELDDAIHIGVHGLKRLGCRLASLAAGTPAPELSSVTVEDDGKLLRVTFKNVQGGLQSLGRPSGFTLRDAQGQQIMRLYKTTLEGDAVLLHLNNGDGPLPSDAHLWYGYGLNPYCNITDAQDQAVPAFGPYSHFK